MSFLNKFLRKRGLSSEAEMAFVDHLEALRWHVIRAGIALVVVSIAVFFNIETIFDKIILGPAKKDFISYRYMCDFGKLIHIDALCMKELNLQFQNTQLSGQFMMSFSTSFMIGFILAFPYICYEFWRFIKPALTPTELKGARGIVFWTSTLFFVGVLFAYFLIAPFTINFFANYQLSPQFKNIITMSNYYDTMSDLILGMGIVFELPVLIFFLSKAGIITPNLMRTQRRYAIVIIMILAAVITPPDWFSIWLVALPLLVLYEAGIFISTRVHKDRLLKRNTYEDL